MELSEHAQEPGAASIGSRRERIDDASGKIQEVRPTGVEVGLKDSRLGPPGREG